MNNHSYLSVLFQLQAYEFNLCQLSGKLPQLHNK
nr:MAG TPA: hypothetical protein [Bacteriophage sp.]